MPALQRSIEECIKKFFLYWKNIKTSFESGFMIKFLYYNSFIFILILKRLNQKPSCVFFSFQSTRQVIADSISLHFILSSPFLWRAYVSTFLQFFSHFEILYLFAANTFKVNQFFYPIFDILRRILNGIVMFLIEVQTKKKFRETFKEIFKWNFNWNAKNNRIW